MNIPAVATPGPPGTPPPGPARGRSGTEDGKNVLPTFSLPRASVAPTTCFAVVVAHGHRRPGLSGHEATHTVSTHRGR